MMAFDDRGIALAAFDDVGIDGALRQHIHFAKLLCHILEYADELFANDLPFLLRLGDALQSAEETLFRIDPDQMDTKLLSKGVFNKISLVLSEQSMIHKHTGQIVADCSMQKHRGNGGIDAAGKRQENLFACKRCLILSYRGFNKAIHFPIRIASADPKKKIPDNLLAVCGVGNLRMKLYTIELSVFITHSCTGTFCGVRNRYETNR